VYALYKERIPDHTTTQLYIRYVLRNQFLTDFDSLIESAFLKEANPEFRIMFLERVKDHYEETEDIYKQTLIENVFAN